MDLSFFVRKLYFVLLLITVVLAPENCVAEATTLYQSIEQALDNNPQLKALDHNSQALEYDLRQAWGGYLPTVDLSLGYGQEQHSDAFTRRSLSEPSDTDWDSRSDATLRLTQPIYDGGDVGSQVSIQKASLDASDYQLQAAKLAITVDTITAHLNVLRQREVVALAEKNLRIHQEIHQSIAERERAGAGSIADVTQVQARLARAEATLYLSQANLKRTIANYTRVVGVAPGTLAYAGPPETLPESLEEILRQVEQGNPELLATDAEIVEAESRVALARTNYKPKIDLELSSTYHDQLEGAQSWENTNAAMVNLSWNLYNGGQDIAGTNAALSRKSQSRAKRAAKLAELVEATESAWANYLSLQRQKASYRDEVNYSRMTFDAYLKQFSVSQRSLLDVLSAENEYFQSAVQVMTADVNEIIAAYQLLSLTGKIEPSRLSGNLPEFYHELNHSLLVPGLSLAESAPEPESMDSLEPDSQDVREILAVVPTVADVPAVEELPATMAQPRTEPSPIKTTAPSISDGWLLSSREGGCEPLTNVSRVVKGVGTFNNPKEFAYNMQQRGYQAFALDIGNVRDQKMRVKVPDLDLDLIFLRAGACP